MTIALTAALIIAIAGFLILLDRKDARDNAQLARLLVHIQAPEVAVAQHAAEHAGPDDPTPVTDDELEEEMRETVERMERLEAEAAPWLR